MSRNDERLPDSAQAHWEALQRQVETNLKRTDTPINPFYYKGKIECIEVIEQLEASFCIGNVIKYLWRWKGKNGIEDLRKAKWYLERAIQEAEKEAENDAKQVPISK